MVLPPSACVLRTCDIARATEHISGVFTPHRLDFAGGARRLAMDHRQTGWSDVSFNELRYGEQVLVNAPALVDYYLLQFTLRGRCEITQRGQPLSLPAGTAAVINPTCGYTKRWSQDAVQVIVRVRRERLWRELAGVLGMDGVVPVDFRLVSRDVRTEARYLWNMVRILAPQAGPDSLLMRRSAHAAAVSHLLTVVLHTVPNSRDEALAAESRPSTPRCVSRARDYIHAHPADSFSLAELAAVAGVASRTLHRGFQCHLGMAPFAYLRSVRLSLARQRLLSAAPMYQRVSDVALDCGYVNLGRFARDYAAQHGERPSATRRRQPKR